MTLGAALERALARRFGAGVRSADRLSGGDINDASPSRSKAAGASS
jgi:hypothetical protein